MTSIKQHLNAQKAIFNYLFYSIVVAIIDTAIVWLAVRFSLVDLVIANTIGVVTGFLIHYFLSSKKVFNTDYGIAGFMIYLSTFVFGLIIANLIIYISFNYVFYYFGIDLRILLSKGLSIVIPFFILYYLRKCLFAKLNRT